MEDSKIIKQSVHEVLAKSYLSYLILCSFGMFFDILFPLKLSFVYGGLISIIFFILGPALIFWAQYTSYMFEKTKKQTGEVLFRKGPYRYLRNPTQLGLLILIAGYALATGAAFLFICTGVAYLISNVFFRRHEMILEHKYGEPYKEYKSSVKKII